MLRAVAEAAPNAFVGGGYWEAMHGTMAGSMDATGATTTCSAFWNVMERVAPK